MGSVVRKDGIGRLLIVPYLPTGKSVGNAKLEKKLDLTFELLFFACFENSCRVNMLMNSQSVHDTIT
jgi:hypothetical protein